MRSSGENARVNAADPFVCCYLLGSVMSNNFLYEPSFEYMINEVSQKSASEFSVVVCGDSIYEITKPFLFGLNKQKDPIARKREKFMRCYNQRRSKNSQLMFWNQFYGVSDYQQFKKFTSSLLDPELTIDKLQTTFSLADRGQLTALFDKIRELEVLKDVGFIADCFNGKNITRLKKQAKRSIEKTKDFVEVVEKRFGVPSNPDPKQAALDESMTRLCLATHQFLADEYAAFLLLMYLDTRSNLMEKLGVTLPDNIPSRIVPRLFYPIDSTLGASHTFDTFSRVCDIYLLYHECLGLPSVQIVNIENISIPEELGNRKNHGSITLSFNSGCNSEVETESDNSSHLKKLHSTWPKDIDECVDRDVLVNTILAIIKEAEYTGLRQWKVDLRGSLKFLLQVSRLSVGGEKTEGILNHLSNAISSALALALLGLAQELIFNYGPCAFTAQFFYSKHELFENPELPCINSL